MLQSSRNGRSGRLIAPAGSPSFLRIPRAFAGETIGLFGGSFNPPHEGHVLVTEIAFRKLGLSRIWWMVTPGNPLKNHSELEALGQRIARSKALAENPRIVVTGFEAGWNIAFTAETIALLKRRCPHVRFVWLMGADNLGGFHRWQDWRGIAAAFPIAVIDRPGSTLAQQSAVAARALSRFRLPEGRAGTLARMKPPAWTFLHGPRSPLSSTALRKAHRS